MSQVKAKVPFFYDEVNEQGDFYTKEVLLDGLSKLSNAKILRIDEKRKVIWAEINYEMLRMTSQDIMEIKGEDCVD